MEKLKRPGKYLSKHWIEPHLSHDWLHTLGRILHEKDKACGLYTNDRSYPNYHAIGALLKPRLLLEVGVRFGYSLASLAHGAGPECQAFGVDPERYEKNSNSYAAASLRLLGIDARLFLPTPKASMSPPARASGNSI